MMQSIIHKLLNRDHIISLVPWAQCQSAKSPLFVLSWKFGLLVLSQFKYIKNDAFNCTCVTKQRPYNKSGTLDSVANQLKVHFLYFLGNLVFWSSLNLDT